MHYLFILITTLTLMNSYVVYRIIDCYPHKENKYFIILLVITILTLLQAIALFAKHPLLIKIEHEYNVAGIFLFIYRASYLLIGIISCLAFYLLTADTIKILLNLLLSSSSPIYLNFVKYSTVIAVLITLSTSVYGVFEVIGGPIVKRVTVSIKNLPASFDGFTIAQISDLHVGPTIKRPYVEKVVGITNGLKPNLIVLTGDFVDGKPMYLRDDIAPLEKLQATHGVFFISGNHEYYTGSAEAWFEEFKNLGITNLINSHVLIKNKEDNIVLAGVTDYSTRNRLKDASNPLQAILGAPDHLIKVLLAHQPASYAEAKQAGYDLQLSGHTHGGQYFPLTLITKFIFRDSYHEGLNNYQGMWIYVNPGTGYGGPPLRIGVPAEVTLLTLKSAAS